MGLLDQISGPVHRRERGVGEQVVFHGLQPLCDLWRGLGELVDDRAQLGAGGRAVGLDEDGRDQRGDHLPLAVAGDREQVALGVDSAALPAGVLDDAADRRTQPGVRVADDEADAVQAAVDQVAEELGPERLVLAVADVHARIPRCPSARQPVAITTALETTWPCSRTWT